MKRRHYSISVHWLHHFNALCTVQFLNCTSYIYSAAKLIACKLLQLLQLLPAIKCSGMLHTVNRCSMNQNTVFYMHFHCTFNVTICSVKWECFEVRFSKLKNANQPIFLKIQIFEGIKLKMAENVHFYDWLMITKLFLGLFHFQGCYCGFLFSNLRPILE